MFRLVLLFCLFAVNFSSGAVLVERTPRIINGTDARENQFPYMASIRVKAWNEHICGGSILSSRWILSAAHCTLYYDRTELTIVVGSIYRVHGGVPYDIENIISHNYDEDTMENDISVIKTRTNIVFSAAIQPIALRREAVGNGVQGVVSGWGIIHPLIPGAFPEKLQWLSKATISNTECSSAVNDFGVEVFPSTLCAFSGRVGAGVCHADSGGPLVVNNQVAGVVSFAIFCGIGLPDGYARVSFYHDWIIQNTRN